MTDASFRLDFSSKGDRRQSRPCLASMPEGIDKRDNRPVPSCPLWLVVLAVMNLSTRAN
jgi:hypothetical protein